MNNDLVIIAPGIEPGSGGLADYTLRLLENLPRSERFQVIVPSKGKLQLPPIATKILVQYSAYGFHHLGYPRDLIRALVDWKDTTGGRLVLMFHEIWTLWPVTNKNFFVQFFHRAAIRQLVQRADFVFTTTPSQAEHLGSLSRNTPIRVLPVGSNIRRSGNLNSFRKRGLAVIFGLAPARVRSLRKMHSNLRTLTAAKVITQIASVGASADVSSEEEERRLLTELDLADGFEQLGAQPEASVSKLLLTASLAIFGQDESSCTKSGTFMAYAAHGLNIVADFADKSKPPPVCWLVAPGELLDHISEAELNDRAHRLQDWQEQTSSWKLIGTRFSEALGLQSNEAVQVASR